MSSGYVKLQTTIPNTNILIDCWALKKSTDYDPSIRFMTSIKNHSVKDVEQMRKASYRIYTSLFNRWYLHQFYEISEDRITVLDNGKPMEIFDSDKNEKIKVTAMEANYCSGSSMFLFQGSFGNVLYTGFFRLRTPFDLLKFPELSDLVQENKLDVAYVDNSYAAEHCNFPPRSEMTRKIIELIRKSGNCKVIISCNQWGKEEVLLSIAAELDEKVDIGPRRYSVFQKLKVNQFFTCQSKETRIRSLDHLITFKECQKLFKQDKSCIIILMTAQYEYGSKKFYSLDKYRRLFILPYSGHSNHVELKEFVRCIRPNTILPVIIPKKNQKSFIIPQSIYDLCGKVDEPSSSNNEKDRRVIIEKSDPTVLVPKLQVSPIRLRRVNGSFRPSATVSPERKSSRLSINTRPCECTSDKASSRNLSEELIETVDASSSASPNKKLSSANVSVGEKEKDRKTSSTPRPSQRLPSSSDVNLSPANVSARETEQIPKSPINVTVLQRSFNHENQFEPDRSYETCPSSSAHSPQTCNLRISAVESVQPLSQNAENPSASQPAGSPNNLIVEEIPDWSGAVTPLRETDDEVAADLSEAVTPLRETEDSVPDFSGAVTSPRETDGWVPELCEAVTPLRESDDEVPDLSEAVTPPRETEREYRLRRKTNAMNMAKLVDANPATSPDNRLVRQESRNVLTSPQGVVENIIDEIPLTLRLQNSDLRFIREDCRNVLLGSTFPRIFQREESVEEMPPMPDLVNEDSLCESDYLIEEYVIEESIRSPSSARYFREDNSNEEAVETDSQHSSMQVDNATTAGEPPRYSSYSKNSSPISNAAISSESYNRLVTPVEDTVNVSVTVNSPTISNFQAGRGKRNRGEDDVTLFELDETVSGRAVTDLVLENTTTVEENSQPVSVEDDSCVFLESRHPVSNSSHLPVRASPDSQSSGGADVYQSDSDDCVVVREYMRGAETPAYASVACATKRLRLDPLYCSKKNDRFVNAIFFHYMKARPQEMSNLAFDHWNFLSGCNIFSHSAYKQG